MMKYPPIFRSWSLLLLFCGLVINPLGAKNSKSPPDLQLLKLADSKSFQMGRILAHRIIHPEMGARKLTLNYVRSEPGDEFPQHVHDYSDDTFLVLQGQVNVRQGDSLRPLLTGQAAFVPAGQIHGTVTTGEKTALLISFQCPPDMVLYTGGRDSSLPGAKKPKGVITPGAVKLLDFANRDGFFVHPEMGSKSVAVAYRKLQAGEGFNTRIRGEGEQLLFVWKGRVSVKAETGELKASETETLFTSGQGSLEVRNDSSSEAIVVQVQSPPQPGWRKE